jgi:hypothetical protein
LKTLSAVEGTDEETERPERSRRIEGSGIKKTDFYFESKDHHFQNNEVYFQFDESYIESNAGYI